MTDRPKPEYGEPWRRKPGSPDLIDAAGDQLRGGAPAVDRYLRCVNFLAGVPDMALTVQPTIWDVLDTVERAIEVAKEHGDMKFGWLSAISALRAILKGEDQIETQGSTGPEIAREAPSPAQPDPLTEGDET
jgi:hypothetical protein